jgi:hypothetical protein
MEEHNINIEHFWLVVAKYAVLIITFVFSLLAKIHTMMAYKKRMTKLECAIEFILSGTGGALVIWILHKRDAPQWILCGVGGFSSLVITPIVTVVVKNAVPTLEMLWLDGKGWLHNLFKRKDS